METEGNARTGSAPALRVEPTLQSSEARGAYRDQGHQHGGHKCGGSRDVILRNIVQRRLSPHSLIAPYAPLVALVASLRVAKCDELVVRVRLHFETSFRIERLCDHRRTVLCAQWSRAFLASMKT